MIVDRCSALGRVVRVRYARRTLSRRCNPRHGHRSSCGCRVRPTSAVSLWPCGAKVAAIMWSRCRQWVPGLGRLPAHRTSGRARGIRDPRTRDRRRSSRSHPRFPGPWPVPGLRLTCTGTGAGRPANRPARVARRARWPRHAVTRTGRTEPLTKKLPMDDAQSCIRPQREVERGVFAARRGLCRPGRVVDHLS